MIELVATDLQGLVKEINLSLAKGLVIKKIDVSVDDREFKSHKAIIDQDNFVELPKEVEKGFKTFTEFKFNYGLTDKDIGDRVCVSSTSIRNLRLGFINNEFILFNFSKHFNLSKEQVETMIKGEQMLYAKK